ncbi:hypothetical protein ACO0K9_21550 [Undibacterium sp. Ji50W]|uniref:hypothetical protein n=1 Tax=Undibacterium sp. Ji50W TaxID=3413041 RepID=UPI003BF26D22
MQANILDQLDAIHEQAGREATQDEVAYWSVKKGLACQEFARPALRLATYTRTRQRSGDRPGKLWLSTAADLA